MIADITLATVFASGKCCTGNDPRPSSVRMKMGFGEYAAIVLFPTPSTPYNITRGASAASFLLIDLRSNAIFHLNLDIYFCGFYSDSCRDVPPKIRALCSDLTQHRLVLLDLGFDRAHRLGP